MESCTFTVNLAEKSCSSKGLPLRGLDMVQAAEAGVTWVHGAGVVAARPAPGRAVGALLAAAAVVTSAAADAVCSRSL